MGQPSIQQMSSDLALRIEEIGTPVGIAILCLSLLLFLQGHRRLPLVSFIIGAAIGYYLSPQVTPIAAELELSLSAIQITGIVCFAIGAVLASLVKMSARLLTSAFIFVTFSTGIQTLNNYGFDVEKSNLWSGIAALAALFFTMGINRILPMIVSAIFSAYGFLVAALLITSNPLSTFEPVEFKTFVLMFPIFIFSIFLQRVDVNKLEEKELAKDDPEPEYVEAQQHFIPL
tara:strand:+ start:695 stop:1387 length:693 start_codon:yes stop_codon:yes gene_type:complete